MDLVGNTGCGDFTCDSTMVLRARKKEENVRLIQIGWST